MSVKNLLLRIPGARSIRRAYRTAKAKNAYRKAVKMAEEAFITTGKRHFVIMLTSGKLAIYSRETFRKHRVKNYVPSLNGKKIRDLISDCVYRTDTLGGNDPLSPEERNIRQNQFIHYYANM